MIRDILLNGKNISFIHMFLAWAYEDAGQWKDAADVWQQAGAIHPELLALGTALQTGGAAGYWRARLAFMLKQKSPNDYQVAVLHARLGESAKVMDCLERAFQGHEPELIYVKREPAFDPIAGDPRFKAL